MTLTTKEKIFCQVYAVNGGDGTEAAIAAGFPAESANAEAARMLTENAIVNYVEILTIKTKIADKQFNQRSIFSKAFSAWKKLRTLDDDSFSHIEPKQPRT
jgi:phage terminase small subunit